MNRCLTIDEEIIIYQFVQELSTVEQMKEWFESYGYSDKKDIIHNLLNIVIQSHPTYEEIQMSAIQLKKLRSPSAVKLLSQSKPFDKFGYEICFLPEEELKVALCILLLTLKKADRRRANEQETRCTHWSHQDLSDEIYLQQNFIEMDPMHDFI